MVTWEQKVEQLSDELDRDSYVRRLAIVLAREGQDGWEFVSAVSSVGGGRLDLLIFKRALTGGDR